MTTPKEIDAIMEAIAKLQRTIDPPLHQKKATVPDEPAPNLAAFPWWLNLVTREGAFERGMGFSSRHGRLRIDCHLLFSPAADPKYTWRQRYPWSKAVLDAFDADPSLDGTCTQAEVMEVLYEPPLTWGGTDYVALSFILEVLPHDKA